MSNNLVFPKMKDNQPIGLHYGITKGAGLEEVARNIADCLYVVQMSGGATNVYFRDTVFGPDNDFMDTTSNPTKLSPKEAVGMTLKYALEIDPKKSANLIDKVWQYILEDKRKGRSVRIEYHPDQDWWITVERGTAIFNCYELNTLRYDVATLYTQHASKRIIDWFDAWLFNLYSGHKDCFKMNSRVLAQFLTNPFRLTEVCQIVYSPGGGKGKSTYTQILKELLGDMCLMDNDFELRNFTDRNTQACLRTYDELRNLKGKKIGKLNGSLTDEHIRVEMKYEHGQKVQNYGMAIITTNNLVEIDDEGRRYYFSDNKNTRKSTREFIAIGKKLGVFVDENRSVVKLTQKGIKALIGWAQLRAGDPNFEITETDDLIRAKMGSDADLWNTCISGATGSSSRSATADEKIANGYLYLDKILACGLDKFVAAIRGSIGAKSEVFRLQTLLSQVQNQGIVVLGDGKQADFYRAMQHLFKQELFASMKLAKQPRHQYHDYKCNLMGKAMADELVARFTTYHTKKGVK